MHISEFNFDLPDELIAQEPLAAGRTPAQIAPVFCAAGEAALFTHTLAIDVAHKRRFCRDPLRQGDPS